MDRGGRPLRRRSASAGHRDRLRPRQSLRLPELRRGGLPGLRHRADDLAASQLLPAPGLPERPCAARDLVAPRLRLRVPFVERWAAIAAAWIEEPAAIISETCPAPYADTFARLNHQ